MKLLMVDDEKIFASQVAKKLTRSWYEVDVLHFVNDLKALEHFDYDLYLFDISLTDGSWFDMISFLRDKKKIDAPIIVVSGYSHVDHKVQWLDLWADDYISKPFLPEELEARIRAVVRRKSGITHTSVIKHNGIKFNLATREVSKWKKDIEMTKKEKHIVEFFLFNKWRLVSKPELVKQVWWCEVEEVTDNTINVTISKVRKKLWADFNMETKVNQWYILNA